MRMDPLPDLRIDLEEEWKSSYDYKRHERKKLKRGNFLPLTELAVNLTNELVDGDLGRVDMYTASDFLHRRSLSSSAPLLLGLLYSRRWWQRARNAADLNSRTSAELFLVSMMVASKYLYDEGTRDDVFNDEWASDFPGVDTDELNRLEAEFLTEMDWDLFVRPSEFGDFLSQLELRLAEDMVRRRRWRTTYKEMLIFIGAEKVQSDAYEALKLFIEAASLLFLVYTCALFSLYLSVVAVRFAHPAVSSRLALVPVTKSAAPDAALSRINLLNQSLLAIPRNACSQKVPRLASYHVTLHICGPTPRVISD